VLICARVADLFFGGGDAAVDLVGQIGAATGEAAAACVVQSFRLS
jgi:hypothetical protein